MTYKRSSVSCQVISLVFYAAPGASRFTLPFRSLGSLPNVPVSSRTAQGRNFNINLLGG
jgi:hypothetical protein